MAIIADTPDLNFPIATTPLGGLDGQAHTITKRNATPKSKLRYAG
jgi:hypothetical protein